MPGNRTSFAGRNAGALDLKIASGGAYAGQIIDQQLALRARGATG
jgi:hypothetical protein